MPSHTPTAWLEPRHVLCKRLPDGTVAEYDEDGRLLGVFLDDSRPDKWPNRPGPPGWHDRAKEPGYEW